MDSVHGAYEHVIMLGDGGSETEWTKTFRDAAGQITRVQQSHGAIALFSYNNAGQRVKAVDPDGVVILYSYDQQGRLDRTAVDINRNGEVAAPDIVTTTPYQVLAAHGTVVQRRQIRRLTDGLPAVASRVDATPNGLTVWSQQWGLLTTQTTALGNDGQKTETAIRPDFSQQVRTFSQERLTGITITAANNGPVVSSTTYTYDAHGRLETSVDARNGTTTNAYDDLDRLISVTTPAPAAGQPAQTTAYEYDPVGRITKTTLPDLSEVAREYFLTGALKKESGAQTYTVEYTYDTQGRKKTMTTHGQAGRQSRPGTITPPAACWRPSFTPTTRARATPTRQPAAS